LVVASLGVIACSAFSNMLGHTVFAWKSPRRWKPEFLEWFRLCPSVSRCHPSGWNHCELKLGTLQNSHVWKYPER
jgi:hypothetical protein